MIVGKKVLLTGVHLNVADHMVRDLRKERAKRFHCFSGLRRSGFVI